MKLSRIEGVHNQRFHQESVVIKGTSFPHSWTTRSTSTFQLTSQIIIMLIYPNIIDIIFVPLHLTLITQIYFLISVHQTNNKHRAPCTAPWLHHSNKNNFTHYEICFEKISLMTMMKFGIKEVVSCNTETTFNTGCMVA